MLINVEKIDDINIILRGTIDHNIIASQVITLKELAEKKATDKKEVDEEAQALSDENYQREAEGLILQEFIDKGMQEANITANETLGQPHFKKYEKQGQNIYLEIELSTTPVIDTSTQYMDIAPTFTKPKANPKTVNAKLTLLAKQQAPYTTIEKPRVVQSGDFVDIDFEGFLNGRALASASEKNYKLKIGSNSFLPGFEAQIIGMSVDEKRIVKVTFPTSYQAKELAGKETVFNVTLHEIREQVALDIDDALAQKVLKDELATLEMLKDKMAEQIVAQAFSNLYNATLKPKIIKGLLSKFDFTLPNNIVEQEIDAQVSKKSRSFTEAEHKRYQEDKEKFLALRESVRQAAKDTVKLSLIVEALAKKEGVIVHDQEVQAALGYQAMMRGQDAQELVKYYEENNLMNSAKMGLTEDKLFGKMLGLDKS